MMCCGKGDPAKLRRIGHQKMKFALQAPRESWPLTDHPPPAMRGLVLMS